MVVTLFSRFNQSSILRYVNNILGLFGLTNHNLNVYIFHNGLRAVQSVIESIFPKFEIKPVTAVDHFFLKPFTNKNSGMPFDPGMFCSRDSKPAEFFHSPFSALRVISVSHGDHILIHSEIDQMTSERNSSTESSIEQDQETLVDTNDDETCSDSESKQTMNKSETLPASHSFSNKSKRCSEQDHQKRLDRIKAEIKAGTYDTEEKFEEALEKMFDRILASD